MTTYPCHRCNMDEGSPVCLQDDRCPSRQISMTTEATPGALGSNDQLGLVMRNVRRLQRHMEEWTRWYGETDVLLRHQLPLPPAGTVTVMEDLEESIKRAASTHRARCKPATMSG